LALLAIIILALPWGYAVLQHPRAPFIYGAVVGGMIGAVTLALLASNIEFLTTEYALLRSATAALMMGGPLGSLLGQAVVAVFVPPRPRQVGALLGLLTGPVFGWPLLYLFPVGGPHGPYWVGFWLGSWAGWCALIAAALGAWSLSWSLAAKHGLGIVFAVMLLPALVVGARSFRPIQRHSTTVSDLEARRDLDGVLWKFDHGEELPEAAAALGRLGQGPDARLMPGLTAVLDGTSPRLQGHMRSDPEYRQARAAAATSLGRLGGSQSLPALLPYAADPDPLVRGAVIVALSELKAPQARAALRKAAEQDPDPDIRAQARAALQPGGHATRSKEQP
jgi:hypothetical protein